MQRARAFLYVSLGILALAGAFHLGARSVLAQAGGSAVPLAIASTGTFQGIFAVDGDGAIYAGEGCFGNLRPFAKVGQLPPSAPGPYAITSSGSQTWVTCANGDIYGVATFSYPNCTVDFCANIHGSPVPTKPMTWGRAKATYR